MTWWLTSRRLLIESELNLKVSLAYYVCYFSPLIPAAQSDDDDDDDDDDNDNDDDDDVTLTKQPQWK